MEKDSEKTFTSKQLNMVIPLIIAFVVLIIIFFLGFLSGKVSESEVAETRKKMDEQTEAILDMENKLTEVEQWKDALEKRVKQLEDWKLKLDQEEEKRKEEEAAEGETETETGQGEPHKRDVSQNNPS